jgi:ElaB/YqjD/DUF883 family membrane-anchored ribosome-binding protein
MAINETIVDPTLDPNEPALDPDEESRKAFESSGKTGGFEKLKKVIADRLVDVAGTLDENAATQDAQSAMAQFEKQASEWLSESAEFVRNFDHEEADAAIRAYIRQNPAGSLLIAGGVGLVIGAFLRRR